MELGPISGIISMPIMNVPAPEWEIPAVFKVEDSPRAGDETYNGSAGQSASSDDDQDVFEEQDAFEDQDAEDIDLWEAAAPGSTAQISDTDSFSQISYFA